MSTQRELDFSESQRKQQWTRPLTVSPLTPPCPPGWSWHLLRDIARLESGHTPSRYRPDWWGGDVPWLALPDIRELDGKVACETGEYTNEAGIANSSARILPAGTVCLSRTASVGFVTKMGRPMATSQDFVNWVCGPDLDPDFLLHLLIASRDYIRDLSSGAVHKTVYVPTVKEFRVCCPPLAEQKRIAGILKEQLAAVQRARAAAAAQLEAAKALPAAYLRSRFETPEAEAWDFRRIGDFAKTCSGATPSRSHSEYFEGDIPWVKTAELRDGEIFDTEEHVSKAAVRETSLRLLPSNTLLVAMYGQGQTRGRTGRLICEATTNQACFAILPNDNEFDTAYLQCWFRHKYHDLRSLTESRGGNQPNLNGVFLRRLEIPFAPLDTQREIAAGVAEYDCRAATLVDVLKGQLNDIEAMPAALFRAAFQGRL